MAEKKKTTKKSTAKSGKRSTKGKSSASNQREIKKDKAAQSFTYQLAPYILGVVAIFLGVCMYAGDNAGVIG